MARMLRHIQTGEMWGYNPAMAEHKMLREYDPDHPELWEYGEIEKPAPVMSTAVASTAEEAITKAMAKAAETGKVEAKRPDDLTGLTREQLLEKQREAEAELEAALAEENAIKNAPPPPPPPPAKAR